ncbi:MAG: aldolase [Rhodospirillaceae bacterium]|jgi:2-keto-3-deoxy-L-rhamnonate aldolase RhmA|nr:aldolase [Rhodospirillaceae bacterium]MBT3493998.1 aldolase [Rhodospirillaceae bacterium]MBT3778881.1 aldolase [Rhodospirillaceae bacterium]MBT3976471.1 aldolase [Rhodospirillaceae bacterium]MBT4170015.1 aldolase [Rhodospirillaceae bacterium]
MPSDTTPMRQRLADGQVVLGLNARLSRTSEIGAILAACGYSWFFVDNEHSPIPTGTAYEMCLGAIRAGITPFARARTNEASEITSWLNNGAMGVFVPHVNTAEEAAMAAQASHYPPKGGMAAPGVVPQYGYERVPLPEATDWFNENVMVVAMIESEQAVANAEAIAAVDGIDALFIGSSDLTYDMGINSQYGHERMQQAVETVCNAARNAGKVAGMGGLREDEDWTRYVACGMRMLLTENDLSLLTMRARERAAFFNGLPTK